MKQILSIYIMLFSTLVLSQVTPSFSTAEYDSIKSVIIKADSVRTEYGYTENILTKDSLELSYRVPRKGLESITVADTKAEIFYWVLREDSTVAVEIKDFSDRRIAEKEYKRAVSHFLIMLRALL